MHIKREHIGKPVRNLVRPEYIIKGGEVYVRADLVTAATISCFNNAGSIDGRVMSPEQLAALAVSEK